MFKHKFGSFNDYFYKQIKFPTVLNLVDSTSQRKINT